MGPSSNRLHRLSAAALLGLSAVVLTSCLQGEVAVKVDKDGSGEVTVEVYPNSNVAAALQGVDVESVIDGAFEGVDGVEFETLDDDGSEGYRLHVPFDDYTDLSDVLVAGGSIAGQQVTLFSSFELTEQVEGGWKLRATINPIGQIIGATQNDSVPGNVQELLDSAGVGNAGTGLDLTIELPGKVTATNADDFDGGAATWHLDEPDAPTELSMQTQPQPLLTPLHMVLGGALLVVLLGIGLSLWGAGRPYQRTEGDRNRKRAERRRIKQAKKEAAEQEGWAPTPVDARPSLSDRPEALPALASAPGLPPMAGGETPTSAPVEPVVPAESGTPSVDTATSTIAPGWYTDPENATGHRWWDGTSWTEHRA